MSDTISRQAAISAYKTLCQGTACKGCPFFDSKGMTDCRLLRALRKVQSAQPKKGKWIPYDVPWYKCSVCGAEREHKIFMEYFCPNCGARMGSEDE